MDELILQEGAGLSRAEVLEDVARQIKQAFNDGTGGDCNFRASDAFTGYSGRVTLHLELMDFDVKELVKTIEIPMATAEQVRARSGTMPPDLSKPTGAVTNSGDFVTALSKPAAG